MSVEDEYLALRMGKNGLVKKLWAHCELDWFEADKAEVLGTVPGKYGMKEFECPFCDDTHQSIEIWSRK
jgi:sarcosine oxidase delta subunit